MGPDTTFSYYEEDGIVWGCYSGGAVEKGCLVGVRRGNRIEFRYVQVNSDGETASGRCTSNVAVLEDGRLRLEERWYWESRAGSGTSILEEL